MEAFCCRGHVHQNRGAGSRSEERSNMTRETENRNDDKGMSQQRNAKEAVYAMLGRCELRTHRPFTPVMPRL